jgi:hypothetical protein
MTLLFQRQGHQVPRHWSQLDPQPDPTCTHHSELQVITALLLISALYELHAKFSQFAFTSRFLATDLNNEDSSASRAQVLLPQPPVQNSCQLTTQL